LRSFFRRLFVSTINGKLAKLRMWKNKPIEKAVEVTYIDHYKYTGPAEGETPDYNLRTAYGVLLEETEDWILIGHDLPWDRRANKEVKKIYKSDILEINVLHKFPTLSDYF